MVMRNGMQLPNEQMLGQDDWLSVEARRRVAESERVPLTVRLLVDTQKAFIETYYPDMLQGGMFIRTLAPNALTLGTRVQLRFVGQDQTVLFEGNGVIAWLQKTGELGFGVQFLRLSPASHTIYREMLRLRRALDERRRARDNTPSPKIPEWAEAPTRRGHAVEAIRPIPESVTESSEWLEGPTRPVTAGIQRLAQASRRPRQTPPRRQRRLPPPPPPRRGPPPPPPLRGRERSNDELAPPHVVSAHRHDAGRVADFTDKVIVPIEDRPPRRPQG